MVSGAAQGRYVARLSGIIESARLERIQCAASRPLIPAISMT